MIRTENLPRLEPFLLLGVRGALMDPIQPDLNGAS